MSAFTDLIDAFNAGEASQKALLEQIHDALAAQSGYRGVWFVNESWTDGFDHGTWMRDNRVNRLATPILHYVEGA